MTVLKNGRLTSIKKRSNAATGSVDNQFKCFPLVKTSVYQFKLFDFKSNETTLFRLHLLKFTDVIKTSE